MVKAINGQSQYFRFQIFCGHKSPICIWSNPSTSWGTRSAVNGHFQSKIGGLGKRKDINIVMNSVLQEKCILKGCSPCHLCLRIFQRWGCREWRWPGLVEGKQRILPDFLRKAEFSLFFFKSAPGGTKSKAKNGSLCILSSEHQKFFWNVLSVFLHSMFWHY